MIEQLEYWSVLCPLVVSRLFCIRLQLGILHICDIQYILRRNNTVACNQEWTVADKNSREKSTWQFLIWWQRAGLFL